MQKLSLISIVVLLAIGSVGTVAAVAMNPLGGNIHAPSIPQISEGTTSSVATTSTVATSSTSSSTSQSTTATISTTMGNSTGLLTNPPMASQTGGDDGAGDDGNVGIVTTQTSANFINGTQTGDD